MSRRAAVLLLVVGGCADDPEGPQRDTELATSSEASTGTDPHTSTSDAPTTTTTTTDGSTSLDPTVPPVDSTTGEPICATTYTWGAAEIHDIVVVVAADPAALGGLDIDALHAWAADVASDAGHHVAVAAPPTGNEPAAGDGYAALALPPGDDPLEIATAVVLEPGFLRAHTPLHLVVATEVDTVWDADMLRSAPEPIRFAQIDARVVVGSLAECDAIAGLSGLVTATAGSFLCTTALAPETVLEKGDAPGEQPACVLSPAGRPPALDAGEPVLSLYGISPTGPESEFPEGPVSCRTSPLGWTIVDPQAATIGLCPARCRNVASWYVAERLTADVAHECPR